MKGLVDVRLLVRSLFITFFVVCGGANFAAALARMGEQRYDLSMQHGFVTLLCLIGMVFILAAVHRKEL